ncbi:MAG: T9SS type A sorting domain-containing protein [Bacteroidia bacterium]|nr:T9SS type A sorting domain-containing protein [Bacteroidia bacterium]
MKTTLLSIAACVALTASLSAQIPNYSFENWATMTGYDNPDSWGTMNNTTTLAGVYTATKATPGSPGNSYLKLTSKTVAGFGVVNGVAVSGKIDSTTMLPVSGFAYNQTPMSFTGKWQHMIYGSSQGSLSATLTRWNTTTNMRETVATATQTLSGMAMSWANFTINFTYLQSNLPDTCIIVLKASGANPTANDYLWVDNLALSGTVTGIENQTTFLNSVVVFPNPSTESINLNLNLKNAQSVTIELTDINGKLIRSKNAGVLQGESIQTINVAGIAKGNYIVRIIGEQGTETKKIVIE